MKRVCYIGGCGRLGLSIAAWTAHSGYYVICMDTSQEMVDAVNKGAVNVMEPQVSGLVSSHSRTSLVATTNLMHVPPVEITFIIVPTPSQQDGSFMLTHVLKACQTVGCHIQARDDDYHLVVIISTVNPGDMDTKIAPMLEKWSGKTVGKEIGLVYSPEFVAQGEIVLGFSEPDLVMIGEHDKRSGDVAQRFYESVTVNTPPIYRMSLASAEIAKIGLNTALTTKMAVANQIAWLCHLTPGADARDVLKAIGNDPRIGQRYFKAGTPDGGPCLPRDNRALIHAARSKLPTPLAEAVDTFREGQINLICWTAEYYMRVFDCKAPIILGVTYKPGVNITEESAAAAVHLTLCAARPIWKAYDPAIHLRQTLREAIADRDFLVIMTPWHEFTVLDGLDLKDKVIFDMWGMLTERIVECRHYIRFGEGEWHYG